MNNFPTATIDSFFILPDDGLEKLLAPLRQAQHSIDIYIYKLTSDQITQELSAAVKRGVAVRAIVERAPSDDEKVGKAGYKTLQDFGADTRWAPPYFVRLHAKSFVVDNSLALISSVNFIDGWDKARDHGCITHEAQIVQGFMATFNADWESIVPVAPARLPLVLSPSSSRSTILGLLESASTSILIEHEQFTDEKVMHMVAAKSKQGVEVRLITPAGSDLNKNTIEHLLKHAPAIQAAYPHKLNTHCKLLIVDGSIMLMGSVNLTAESLDQRREVSLLISDAAAIGRAQETADKDANG